MTECSRTWVKDSIVARWCGLPNKTTASIHAPAVVFLMRDQRADANDRVVDVLRKLVAHGVADVGIALSLVAIGGRDPCEIGNGLDIPGDDTSHAASS